MAKSMKDLPLHHRFTGAYKPPLGIINVLGICECGCREAITSEYVYVVCEGDYFVDQEHFMSYHGAVEIG